MSRPASLNLSIVIPAYNEANRLPTSLDTILKFVEQLNQSVEVIVVDDGSCDQTVEVARQQQKKFDAFHVVTQTRNQGKGAAVKKGIECARGEWILFTDADLSTPITEYHQLAAAIRQGADIAIASRDLPGAQVSPPQPFYRELMGKTFNKLVQLIVLPGIQDTQCGFKLFRQATAKQIIAYQTIKRFGFDVELLYIARCLGARIAEIPVRWHDVLGSKVSPVKDAGQMFVDLFRIRWRHRHLVK